MVSLYWFSCFLVFEVVDQNYFYFFEFKSFFMVKVLNVVLFGGFCFELFYKDIDFNDEDFGEFNVMDCIIFRNFI